MRMQCLPMMGLRMGKTWKSPNPTPSSIDTKVVLMSGIRRSKNRMAGKNGAGTQPRNPHLVLLPASFLLQCQILK